MRLFAMALIAISVSACTNDINVRSESNESSEVLKKFAYANCIMWYFDSKGYDTDDIRSISAGLVETSDISLDKFQELALLVKEYDPNLETKQNIDKNLLKCFYLDKSKDINKIIGG